MVCAKCYENCFSVGNIETDTDLSDPDDADEEVSNLNNNEGSI